MVGPRLALGITSIVLGMCSDQAGSCETQESERVINKRIAKEFPGAYSPPDYCLIGVGWPCIEIFTGGEKGPGYDAAREIVMPMLSKEYSRKSGARTRELD